MNITSKENNWLKKEKKDYWEIPYLPINPADVNRQYEPIIRINSQSGKGGVAFILENEYGYKIPKEMRQTVGYFIKNVSDEKHRELNNKEIFKAFIKEYQNRKDTVKFVSYSVSKNKKKTEISLHLKVNDEDIEKTNVGNGPIDAAIGMLKSMGYNFEFKDYVQQSFQDDEEKSIAISYINIVSNNKDIWAIGKDEDIVKSSLLGIISAINKI